MGKLINGKWVKSSIITSDKLGNYDRQPRTLRNFISFENKVFKPESGRYHLYVSYACPWATRTLIYRSIKKLENHISVSVVHPDMLENGWSFKKTFPKTTGDDLFGFKYLYQIYQKSEPNITSSVTVPVLWDKKTNKIVNNESSEIIRMLNFSFNKIAGNELDYYPKHLQAKIDKWNKKIYDSVNNGVYKSGFAKTQIAYDKAVIKLFKTLDILESHFKSNNYLAGNELTEADIRLIPTLLRFDIVYYVHFKTNIKRIKDYPNISSYIKNLMSNKAISKNHFSNHIKRHYYYSHESINPLRIIPKGPNEEY